MKIIAITNAKYKEFIFAYILILKFVFCWIEIRYGKYRNDSVQDCGDEHDGNCYVIELLQCWLVQVLIKLPFSKDQKQNSVSDL